MHPRLLLDIDVVGLASVFLSPHKDYVILQDQAPIKTRPEQDRFFPASVRTIRVA